ncbi:MAG: AAA family ATPase [Candidatus Symbiothrix sp.]|jgi:cellulose biosynthesis protein BcsQ|nr:AAA family ATPase [Candidatus Symbiothrix sp.]
MKTITFYSYKGGVGRTLALVNIANRLAEFGKKVCIMDFDLEAPGLNHKYKRQINTEIKQGLVDYIYEFAVNDILPPSIRDYAIEINTSKKQNNITFIPAGNSEQGKYWKKLSRISWWNLFYRDNSEGIPFFLDLKEKIKKEFSPDYLLIDTRTGITEIAAITMSLLAESIVLFAVNNEENICGTQQIIRTITKKENKLLDTIKEIHFVLTRIPFPNTPEGRSREYEIKNLVEQKIKDAFKESDKELKSFNVIHSDREIELFEKVRMSYDTEYLSLFNSLTGEDFSPEEKEKFDNLKRAEWLLQKAYNSFENNSFDLLKQLDEIEKLAPELSDSYLLRGRYYNGQKEYKKAVEAFTKGIKMGDISGGCLFFRSESYFRLKNYSEVFDDLKEYIDKEYKEYRVDALMNLIIVKEYSGVDRKELIVETTRLIEKYPFYAKLYNVRSCLYNWEKQYESALEDIYKAIDLEPQEGIYYATLAEIKFNQGDKLDFYRNFDTALRMNFDIESILFENDVIKNIYKQVSTDSEFIRILDKYNKSYFLELI